MERILNRKAVEARAWTIKYFIVDSDEKILFVLEIRGINLIKLISNPIHAPIQDDDEIEISVPEINTVKNKIL